MQVTVNTPICNINRLLVEGLGTDGLEKPPKKPYMQAQAEEEIAVAEDKAARLAAEKWNAAADAACHIERAARLETELAELRARLGPSAEEAKAAADARAGEVQCHNHTCADS